MIETVSFLKKNAAALPLSEPLTITQNGKPSYVVTSYEEHERREQAIAMIKMLSFAESDIKQSRTSSMESLKERLAARKN
ncbi:MULTISPECIES: type II toxin-antitoxin system prevent-host-death family antitoxin [Photobacterium]|uniref:Type II toxin-antitoxin system prevent-host-death family antitoxin n=1 Tax=Photobacterium aquimaris TaxID=512643 RepID=A0A2T3I0S1_9GAMM|nr:MULTISPECIES: type II toxin-antitoxin system prevent-host-death family antitoxin [Photobacterium]MEC6817129.1 type II toxin-antitoxin system prevent-host-death family antitoxin [Photobacterium toruni]OBU25676.1 prevent-host-death protein [Photobacterium aquimaris]PQJ37028.1 prevent-host-death protein [Photobacterium aquimaris]PSU10117.1 type II toxin-antitoxin system prevent-host-death family antitoxin [Photobacterium aquimaris]